MFHLNSICKLSKIRKFQIYDVQKNIVSFSVYRLQLRSNQLYSLLLFKWVSVSIGTQNSGTSPSNLSFTVSKGLLCFYLIVKWEKCFIITNDVIFVSDVRSTSVGIFVQFSPTPNTAGPTSSPMALRYKYSLVKMTIGRNLILCFERK